MALRQHERLREPALLVNTGQIETAIQSIIPTTGEDYPMGIHVPVMIAVGLIAVDLLQLTRLTCMQVKQPLITLLMPYREIAIVQQGKHDVLPIV